MHHRKEYERRRYETKSGLTERMATKGSGFGVCNQCLPQILIYILSCDCMVCTLERSIHINTNYDASSIVMGINVTVPVIAIAIVSIKALQPTAGDLGAN